MHSALQEWHFLMHYLVSFIQWLIKQVLHSLQDIFRTDVLTQFTFHTLSNTTPKIAVAAKRYAEIARRMGLAGTSEQALINSLVEKIDEFNVRLNIPKTLKDFGINEEEFKEKVDKIAELAVGDACTGSNPRAIDPAAMAKLLTCTYYGTEVDF